MKKLLVIISLLGAVGASAQGPTAEQKKAAVQKADSIVALYIRYSSFIAPGKSTITPEATAAFARLFTPDAQIPNEVHPEYFYRDMKAENLTGYRDLLEKKGIAGHLRTVSVQDFVRKVEALNKDGFVVRLANANVSYKEVGSRNVKVLLAKSLQSFFNNELILETKDTVQLTIRLTDDFSNAAISNIAMMGYQVRHVNDADRDFVADKNDKCPNEAGFFSADGCPTVREKNIENERRTFVADSIRRVKELYDAWAKCYSDSVSRSNYIAKVKALSAVPPKWWITAGVMGGTGKFDGTQANYAANYQQANADSFRAPTMNFKSGSVMGGFVQVERYFGTKANFGIGVGIAYTMMKGTMEGSAFRVQYKATDAHIPGRPFDYRQIISSNGSFSEEIKNTTMSVPILLIYKGDISSKLGFRIEAGAQLNVSSKTTMESAKGSFDYEAVYRFNSDNQSVYSPTTGENDWIITRDYVSKHGNAESYFSALRGNGYPVGLGIAAPSQSTESTLKSSVGILVRPSLSYKVNPDFSLNLGFFYSTTSFTNSTSQYQLVNESGRYNTMLNGFDKLKASSYGVSLSITRSLFYPRARWKRDLDDHQKNGIKSCGPKPTVPSNSK
ncbi:hypothetical protein [Flaviaesturariibacter amylovorans]|uniref:Outer membrane protein beta-barrel domain-containing protein n=1 Tax=Flaviaesturariibacter amylovorans TaxID=1084520 RepID=A0ABP8HRE2_9BACT